MITIKNNLFDSHFHLDYYKNHKEIYEQINQLQQPTLCVTNSPEVYISCRNIYPETKYVKFAVGYNPNLITSQHFNFRNFKYAIKTSNFIGEIGLDFSKKLYSSKDEQINLFKQILKLASEDDKILSIHSYLSEDYILDNLLKYKIKNVILHWYTGSDKYINDFIKIGCYFSINCNMIHSKKNLMLKKIPQNRLLIESDGPFTKVNNIQYNPSLLNEAYKITGTFLGISNFREVVFDNFMTLFNKKWFI